MKVSIVSTSEIKCAHQLSIKPSSFLHVGQIKYRQLKNRHAFKEYLVDVVSSIYRPGIFKRIFVQNKNAGLLYIPASSMMMFNPRMSSKILSQKYTRNIEPMILKHNSILVSCAGTIGNIRFIDKNIENIIGSQDIIRVEPQKYSGYIYAYLSSTFVQNYLNSKIYGSVVSRLEPKIVENIPLIRCEERIKLKIDNLIKESFSLREDALKLIELAEKILKEKACLKDLTSEDYDYFGSHTANRKPSCFTRNISDVGTITFNAFNHSERIRKIKQLIPNSIKLSETLIGNSTFSTGSFPRIEVKAPYGVKLINQSDAFDTIIKGKNISRRKVKLSNLVEYGEIIVAGVGTLGENETFCRVIFGNEDLEGQLISGEFIRMKTNGRVPAGYIYTWLNSDYGFRLIRNIQSGTKLCRPIPKLLLNIPIPIIGKDYMEEIDKLVRTAHTKRHIANQKELKAIAMVEAEIEKWN